MHVLHMVIEGIEWVLHTWALLMVIAQAGLMGYCRRCSLKGSSLSLEMNVVRGIITMLPARAPVKSFTLMVYGSSFSITMRVPLAMP